MTGSGVVEARTLLERCGIAAHGLSDAEAETRAREIAAAAGDYGAAVRADLSARFDEHVADEFVLRDVDATMETMVDEPYLDHVPVMTGGVGRDEVRRFYAEHFIGKWPEDTEITSVSRTIGPDQVVDEMVMSLDQASMLVQLGVLDPAGPPVTGVEQARKLIDKSLPTNTLITA